MLRLGHIGEMLLLLVVDTAAPIRLWSTATVLEAIIPLS